jgi:DNA-binding transcriptional regulator YiaG
LVAAIRRELGLTQEEFAGRVGLPVGTIRDWEQHRRQPDDAARVLLQIIGKGRKQQRGPSERIVAGILAQSAKLL